MIAWFATKGSGTNDAMRMEALLSGVTEKREWPFDKKAKYRSFLHLVRLMRHERPKLLVMEGTGIAGGLLCMLGRVIWKVPYMFSSGDAVGPFVGAHVPWAGPAFGLYERLLCRLASGFIGWTPYLCGRAMTFGCRRTMTAPGWSLGAESSESHAANRTKYRKAWGIPDENLVVGLVGALEWNGHRGYCYGLELVRAAAKLQRTDVTVVVVGSGSGLEKLKEEAGATLGVNVVLPGAVTLDEVIPCMAAFDVASLPQSMDAVGAFRYTTKLSEYAKANLPVITSRIPMSYDLGEDWMWRLPGEGPWTEAYIGALAALLETMDRGELDLKRQKIPQLEVFQRDPQVARVTQFMADFFEEVPA